MNFYRIFIVHEYRYLFLLCALLSLCQTGYSQTERKHLREGNSDYKNGKYSESELSYRRASELPKNSPDAWFSLGNSMYKQDKYEDAAASYEKNAAMYDDNTKKSNTLYNLGNALLGSQKIEESIDAYKNSLKLNPSNMQAKYNLSYAQDLLQEKKEQEQQQQQDQNKDQKDDKEKENNDGDQDNQREKDQNQQNSDQDQQNQDQDKQQNQGEQKISQEDARRLLEALASDEMKVQDKVQKDKAAAAMVKTLKNW